jgi:hypothetical protein
LPLKGSQEPTSNTDPGSAASVGETLVEGMAVALGAAAVARI